MKSGDFAELDAFVAINDVFLGFQQTRKLVMLTKEYLLTVVGMESISAIGFKLFWKIEDVSSPDRADILESRLLGRDGEIKARAGGKLLL